MKIFYKKENLRTLFSLLKLLLLTVIVFICTSQVSAQVVSPVQSGHYMPGVTNVRDMAQPPPGLFVIWYNIFISSNQFYDKDGNAASTLFLNQIDPSLPNIELQLDLNGFATVPALFWASNFTLLGGARYMAGISPNYTTASGTIISEIGLVDTSITSIDEGSVSGFSDLLVVPAGLSWGLDQFDVTLTYGFYAPTGKYETGGSDNIGLGFWTHQFQGYGYYYPFPDKSTAVMLGLTYEANSKIKDVDVTPGSRFSLELAVSQYLSERFEVGVHGSANWQIGDDTGNDVFWDPSVRDQKSTVAFSAAYWPWKNRFYINAKYAFDFGVKQRFKNNYWMVNFIFLTNLLTGS